MRFADLLAPVSDESPCGDDLEYDRAFIMLHAAVAARTSAQYGDFVDAPPSINWAEAEREARALLARTKDIRLAVILVRAGTRQRGAPGLRDGLALLQGLLERYGEALHPSPVFEGERDPVMFANAIAALADVEGALADAREIALPKASGMQLQLRDIEKAQAMPRQKDALSPESLARLLKELWGRRDDAVLALVDAQRSLAAINAWAGSRLDADAPDLSALAGLLQPFADLDQPAQAGQSGAAEPEMSEAAQWVAGEPGEAVYAQEDPAAGMWDRWSALATMQQVRMWFEENEPSSPVVVMLRQAERMVGKRFSELAHIIPADLLAKWDEVEA